MVTASDCTNWLTAIDRMLDGLNPTHRYALDTQADTGITGGTAGTDATLAAGAITIETSNLIYRLEALQGLVVRRRTECENYSQLWNDYLESRDRWQRQHALYTRYLNGAGPPAYAPGPYPSAPSKPFPEVEAE